MKDYISIMVADNDPEVIQSTWRALNQEGHSVEGVFSGKEAIEKIKQNSYDLVFTELMLRRIDGITLIKWLRQYRPSIGIVSMTDNPLKETLHEARELGVLSHMWKPLTPEMIIDATKKAIEMISEIEPEEDLQPVMHADNASETDQEEDLQPAKLAELERVIHEYREKSSNAIWVLSHAQDIFGYLPPMIQERVAEGLNMNLSEVRSIISFYSGFRTAPKGVHAISDARGIEKAWNSVTWMTGNKAVHAVNDFIKERQLHS